MLAIFDELRAGAELPNAGFLATGLTVVGKETGPGAFRGDLSPGDACCAGAVGVAGCLATVHVDPPPDDARRSGAVWTLGGSGVVDARRAAFCAARIAEADGIPPELGVRLGVVARSLSDPTS